jgi:hypothetical protein
VTKYLDKKFSSPPNSKAYVDNWDAIFGDKPKQLCPKPVFVDDGWPMGQCLREVGHPGLCDVYNGDPDKTP